MKKIQFLVLMFFVWVHGAVAASIDQTDPKVLVEQLSNSVLKALNEQRAELESDPQKVQDFADRYVLPYVDTPKMARFVMGRYWRVASDAEQKNFVDEFTKTLLRSYAVSLLKLKIDRVEVKPVVEEKKGRVLVPSEVTQSDGNVTDVTYRAYLSKKTQQWMLYDVTIEGISMLINYQKTYGSEFGKKGISKVIVEMKEKNEAFMQSSAS